MSATIIEVTCNSCGELMQIEVLDDDDESVVFECPCCCCLVYPDGTVFVEGGL